MPKRNFFEENEKRERLHYVDNKRFAEEMAKYVEKYNDAITNSREIPRVSDYIGECFINIATRLALKNNFSGYTYKDDMINDAIIYCMKGAHKFDINKGSNAFAYFTQVCFHAFINRIKNEKKQAEIKKRYKKKLNRE